MPSAWITHVKQYAAENNIPYKEALSKASASYKKGSGATHTMPDGTIMKGKTHGGEGCCGKDKGKNKKKIHPEIDYIEPKKKTTTVAINKKGKAKYFETDTAEPEVKHQRRNSKISSLSF